MLTDEEILNKTYTDISCKKFIKERNYIMSYITKTERDFPIAFR